MATRDHYMTVARQVSSYLDDYGLAFKTYNTADFDKMLKEVAGEGARVTTEETASEFKNALLERGFVIFPSIMEVKDGYVRVIRANSLTNNLLSAFRYVGANGDDELRKLLNTLKRRPNSPAQDVESSIDGI